MSIRKPKPQKAFRYTVTFTVETSHQVKPEDVEEKAAEVWDAGMTTEKLFVDSYNFLSRRKLR